MNFETFRPAHAAWTAPTHSAARSAAQFSAAAVLLLIELGTGRAGSLVDGLAVLLLLSLALPLVLLPTLSLSGKDRPCATLQRLATAGKAELSGGAVLLLLLLLIAARACLVAGQLYRGPDQGVILDFVQHSSWLPLQVALIFLAARAAWAWRVALLFMVLNAALLGLSGSMVQAAHLQALQYLRTSSLCQQVCLLVLMLAFQRLYRNIREHARTVQQLESTARTDLLTGLPNRRAMSEAIVRALQSSPAGPRHTLSLVDLDHFKSINDRHGHSSGDDVLVRVAALLCHQVQIPDCLGRWGGEEFAVLSQHASAQDAARWLRGVLTALSRSDWPGGLALTASAGVAALEPQMSEQELIERADHALYEAKAQGRNRVCVFAPATDP